MLPLQEVLKALETEQKKRVQQNKLALYRPYTKQSLFHAKGGQFRERLLRAGNQLGKSFAGAAEAAFHATGLYPDWWEGRRWDRPTTGWAGGVTSEVTRDTIQRLLIGPLESRGTGLIPARCIEDTTAARGVADLMDTILISHVNGGTSRIRLKYFEQGRQKWQGETLDWVWFDEEPPEDIYTEGLTRTNATGGIAWTTFTPLLGMSSVVRRFLMEDSEDRSDTNMTIDDAEHIAPEERARIINSYPAHEREARINGTPSLGSGVIFPVTDESISIEAFPIPPHWTVIGALDFGWDHPTAAVRLAWDRDADAVYVTHAYKMREAVPAIHVAALKAWGEEMPWAWPHDGLQHDKASGEQLAAQYRKLGLKMLPERAQYENERGSGVEAGLMDMLERMETGRWHVFSHLTEWFEEKRLYHRKDGRVVKEFDDLMSASRYGLMSLRFAKTVKPKPKVAAVPTLRPGPQAWMGR